MSRCSFLSTYDKKVSCFEECPFFGCAGSSEPCPFKFNIKEKLVETNILYEYDFMKSEGISFLDDLYESNRYLKILQL